MVESELTGREQRRFKRYEKARAVASELHEGLRQGKTVRELAKEYGLGMKDVEVVLYALHASDEARN